LNFVERAGFSRNATPLRQWQGRVALTVFVTYATYYFCRQNIAAALPAIGAEFDLTRTQLGQITMALFLGYGLGQVFFGLMSDRFGARYLLLIGMLVSAGLNVAFALAHPVIPMVALWGLNGVFQASGMPALAKTIANWFTPGQRGRVQAIRGMDYPMGAMLITLLSGYLVQYWGWRWAFYVPAGILTLSAVHTFARLRGAPEDVGLPPVEEHGNDNAGDGDPSRDEFAGWRYVLKMTLGSWRIWALALGFFGITMTRYGFGIWAITYLIENGSTVTHAAAISSVMWLGGAAGILTAGWAGTLWFQGRHAPFVVMQLVALAVLTALFPLIPVNIPWLLVIYLMAVGFCTYGPDMMMCQTMAMDLATRKATATAGGFIDATGSLGAALTVAASGHLVDTVGWSSAMYLWAAGAGLAAILTATLWNWRPRDGEFV
jgi:sugar phosphate permease